MIIATALAVAAVMTTPSEPPPPDPRSQHIADWGAAIQDAFGDINAASLACTEDGIVCFAVVNPADLPVGGCILIGSTSAPELVDDYASGDAWGFTPAIEPTTLEPTMASVFGMDEDDVDTALNACIALDDH